MKKDRTKVILFLIAFFSFIHCSGHAAYGSGVHLYKDAKNETQVGGECFRVKEEPNFSPSKDMDFSLVNVLNIMPFISS